MCCCLQQLLYVRIPARFLHYRVFVPPCICMTCVYFLHHLVHVCMYIVVIFCCFFSLISCACICVTSIFFSVSACCCKFCFASRSLCICICESYCNCLRHLVYISLHLMYSKLGGSSPGPDQLCWFLPREAYA